MVSSPSRLCVARPDGMNGNFSAAPQIEVVASLNEDRSCAGSRADGRADGRAFTAACKCADQRADRRTDTRAGHGSLGLAVFIANTALIVDADVISVRRANILDISSKWISFTVGHSD